MTAPADTKEDRKSKQLKKPARPIPAKKVPPVLVNSFSSAAGRRVRFTPQLSVTKEPTEILIRNGPHCLTLLNLLSLEPTLSRGKEMTLKAWDKDLRTGWLYDAIIDSFFLEAPRKSASAFCVQHNDAGSYSWLLDKKTVGR